MGNGGIPPPPSPPKWREPVSVEKRLIEDPVLVRTSKRWVVDTSGSETTSMLVSVAGGNPRAVEHVLRGEGAGGSLPAVEEVLHGEGRPPGC